VVVPLRSEKLGFSKKPNFCLPLVAPLTLIFRPSKVVEQFPVNEAIATTRAQSPFDAVVEEAGIVPGDFAIVGEALDAG
jgi:hypothetical protein